MADLNALDATALLQALDGRRISATELLEASAARAHALKASINAVVAEDLEAARRRAHDIDERRAKGETSASIGLLAGLPMTIKDTFDVDGLPASAGVAALLNREAADAVVVGHVRTEGAVIWGKTNVPVMAGDWQSFNPVYGVTNNPWDLERTPGGSSGGAAAALATGMTPLEIGSDIGGSLRVPASFCGVYSHKPTWGLVSQRGHVPPRPGAAAERDLNVVGPMARSVRDLRLLLSIIAPGPIPAKAAPIALSGLRIGLWLEEPAFIVDAEVKSAIEAFVSDLMNEGAVVEPVKSPVDGQTLLDAYITLLMPYIAEDGGEGQRRLFRALRGPAKLAWDLGLRPAWAMQALSATASHLEWLAADEVRAKAGRTMKAWFERYDALLCPVAPVVAFPHNTRPFPTRKLVCSDDRKIPYDSMLRWIALATACGLPATTLPVGLSGAGLPVGAQLIGPRGGDSKLLSIAESIEKRVGGFVAPEIS